MIKIINLKSPNKHYTSRVYTFKNENHFTNWYNKMIRLGYKITGIE